LKEFAVTGSDPYVREGTDITVVFHVADAKQFRKALDPFLDEARRANRGKWHEAREEHGDAVIETYTTPLREVSLHRVTLGDHVIVSNSKVALNRVLAAHAKKAPRLGDSLDFKYMRTCFRADDPEEDGFAFLPDAFIRRLVGPADRIKQLRRADALAALHGVHHAALLYGWEHGTPPPSPEKLQQLRYLRPEDLSVPEGKPVAWDSKSALAHSEAFGTVRFATPLVELPVDDVTPAERDAYERFRRDYMGLWTRFSDPVGMRFRHDGKRTRMEAYILPVIRSSNYQTLRWLTGGGTVKLDPGKLGPATVLFLGGHLGGEQGVERGSFFVRLDDSPVLKEVVAEIIRADREGRAEELPPRAARRFLDLPLVVGLEGETARQVRELMKFFATQIADRGADLAHRDVAIRVYRVKEDQLFGAFPPEPGEKEPFRPTIYAADIGEGLYFGFRPEPIKQLIDRHKDRREGKAEGPGANVSLLAAPHRGPDAREAANAFLEWQTHRRALPGNAVWYALHRSGAVPAGAGEADERHAALHHLGYLPVSPDGSAYLYDRRTDEALNRRHGSWRQPQLRPTLAVNAPLRQVLEQFKTVRIDLRFREDGIHTTLTWER
jgi:hypothetical protein